MRFKFIQIVYAKHRHEQFSEFLICIAKSERKLGKKADQRGEPCREYGGVLYPAGRYRALRILLGEAGGENWWCILFPPLCVIRTAPTPGPEPGCTPSEAVRQPAFESLFLRLFRLITKGKTE